MMQTKICVDYDAQRIELIKSPFSESNNATWKALGGIFNRGVWQLPDTLDVRKSIADLFGTRSIEVEARVPATLLIDGPMVQIGGYLLAARRYRDGKVGLYAGVKLIEGVLPESAGSKQNPLVGLNDGCEFSLRCRKAFAKARGLEILYDPGDPEIDV